MTCAELKHVTRDENTHPTASELMAVYHHVMKCPSCRRYIKDQQDADAAAMDDAEREAWLATGKEWADRALAAREIDPELGGPK